MSFYEWLDTGRWWIAVLFVISMPPALLYWFVVHPFVRFWRRLGPKVTFTVLIVGYLGMMAAIFPFRAAIVGRDLGGHLATFLAGLPLIVVTSIIENARKRHLTFRILAGVPEIATGDPSSGLLSEGIYSRIRHPRYAGFIVGSIGWALWLNYVGVYAMVAAAIVAILLIIPVEERELRDRFGDAWTDYAARVPRLIPRR